MLGFASSLPVALRPLSAVRAARTVRPLVCSTASVSESVSTAIRSERVLVFSKSRCPYCVQAKSLLRNECGVDPTVWELDQMPNGGDIQAELMKVTGQRTVPNIFIEEEHIGGCDDLMDLFYDGTLTEKLAQKADS